jgi:hypothetical protein
MAGGQVRPAGEFVDVQGPSVLAVDAIADAAQTRQVCQPLSLAVGVGVLGHLSPGASFGEGGAHRPLGA